MAEAVGGFLNINKDRGPTSTGVVRRVKRLTGQKKVGHTGTLDPIAAGVLPVCMGRATRFSEAVVNAGKTYSMVVRLGSATDTFDADGKVTREADPSNIERSRVETVLSRFRGEISQVPPMFSALKVGGRPLYEIARAGGNVERSPRAVTIRSLELTDWSPPDFTLAVECSRGFYARSLANDLGEALESAAHMRDLIRLRVGPFHLADAITLDDLERMVNLGNWIKAVHPPDYVLGSLPEVVLDPLLEERFLHGQPVPAVREIGTVGSPTNARVYSADGRFLALARYDPTGPWWWPDKVMSGS